MKLLKANSFSFSKFKGNKGKMTNDIYYSMCNLCNTNIMLGYLFIEINDPILHVKYVKYQYLQYCIWQKYVKKD